MPGSISIPFPKRSPLEELRLPLARAAGVRVFCKRDDRYFLETGSPLQGNKLRKLGPLIELLRTDDHPIGRLISFGGNHSNHAAALSDLGRRFGVPVTLLIRGEPTQNSVMDLARSNGAELRFVSRGAYRRRHEAAYREEVAEKLADLYNIDVTSIRMIGEGGTDAGAVVSCEGIATEIRRQLGESPDVTAVSMGTGGTAAGIVRGTLRGRVEVYPALRGKWVPGVLGSLVGRGVAADYSVVENYDFGGYARYPREWRTASRGVATWARLPYEGLPPLEPIYTAKLFAGVLDRVAAGCYPRGTTIVMVHTGGIY